MSKVNTLSLHPRRKPTRESMADNGNVSHRDGGGASAASRRKRLHKRKKKKSDPGIVHGRVRDLADWDPQYTGTESVGVKEHSVSSENLKKESVAVPQLASGDSSKSEASLLSPKKKRSRKKQSLQTPLRSSKSLESFDFTEKLHSVQDLSRSIEHLEKLKREVEETTRKKLEEKHRLEKKRQKIEHQRQLLKQQEEIEQRKLSQKLAEKERLKQEIIKKVGEEIYYRMELESQKNIQLAKLEEQKLELEKLHESIQKTQDSIKLGSLDTFGASVTEIGSPDASDSGQGLRESRDREPDLIKSVNQSIKRNSSAEMEREEPVGQEETILTSSGQTAEADTPVHFDQTSPHEGDISRSDSGRVDSGHFYTDYQDTEDKYCVEDATDYCESESETCDVEVVEDSETFNQFVCEEENADDPEVRYLQDFYDEEVDSVAVGFAVATPQTPVGMSILEEIQLTEKIQQMDALWYQQVSTLATLESIGNPLDPYDGTLESYKANGTSMPGPENGAGDLEVTTDDQSQKAEEVEAKNGADVSEVASDSKNQEASDQQADTALSDALDSEVKDVQTAAVTEEEVPVASPVGEGEGIQNGADAQSQGDISAANGGASDQINQSKEEDATNLLLDTEKLLHEAGIDPENMSPQMTSANGGQGSATDALPAPTTALEEAGVISDNTPVSELLASPQIENKAQYGQDRQGMADLGVIFDRSVEVVSPSEATTPAAQAAVGTSATPSQLVDSTSSSTSNQPITPLAASQTPIKQATIEVNLPAVIGHVDVQAEEVMGDAVVSGAVEEAGDEKSPLLTPSEVEEIMKELEDATAGDDDGREVRSEQQDPEMAHKADNSEPSPEVSDSPEKTVIPAVDAETPSSEQAPLLGSDGKEDSVSVKAGCCSGCSIL